MAPSSRDRISVDLHGLKAALFERAQALGVSPSGLVRTTLAEALGRSDPTGIDRSMPSLKSGIWFTLGHESRCSYPPRAANPRGTYRQLICDRFP